MRIFTTSKQAQGKGYKEKCARARPCQWQELCVVSQQSLPACDRLALVLFLFIRPGMARQPHNKHHPWHEQQ